MNKHNFKRDHPEVFDEAVSDLDWEKIFEHLENVNESEKLAEYINDHIEAYIGSLDLLPDHPDPDASFDEARQQAFELGFESIAAMLYGKR